MNRLLALVICFAMLSILPIYSLAHSGGTDSKGGHTDNSTGEYHYHHGYSAHDHYDMNGDGIKDCPYNFVDATDNNRGKSNNNSSTNYQSSKEVAQKEKNASFKQTVVKILETLCICGCMWASISYLLSFIFLSIYGDDAGCLLSMLVSAVFSIAIILWYISLPA